jgi:hypothetical protein
MWNLSVIGATLHRQGTLREMRSMSAMVSTRLIRCRQQMQDCIGGAAHRHIECHRVFKCGFRGDIAWQDRRIILLVIAFCQINDQATCL